ncbi:hypothetical protein UA38_10305 [Photobacterium kishitanii]|uniref:Uncharacterized protein n=1 Tax=Photobacterium kishitanii TaxID=318456 RepID=A0AAX0YY77_9GAMM|nr:hypothetical protein [Photobacterium kishitanii]KJG57364.1 hypothetical protein UA38_10305 [Photobacterium kishitanii]KJG60840.1 hypothetical protein UA42_12975 [Photobacterium kishitanii]KJG65115.1 hypothetical protein UA40_12855 [Photobacterium kishitanii]KJG69262.1 hypothetical protein UA41_12070 [Photobacterium kishitanii]PSX16896.1 hypothetical protein C0W70_22220 [Photobacterium kishitanii]
MFIEVKLGFAVMFFVWMLTRSLYKKATWLQLTIVGLQIFSVLLLIELSITHYFPEFLKAKWFIGVFFAAVFVIAAAKERYLFNSEKQREIN